jgi:mRNA-degrading endonuclease toxin of MazEF toxin-antitoxin module
VKRGDVYLVNFKKKYRDEFSKIRPALIFQSDILNEHIEKLPFKTVAVIPLSSQILGGHFRVTIESRDLLERNSEVVVNWICTLDHSLVYSDKRLTKLNAIELKEVEEKVMLFLGYKDR